MSYLLDSDTFSALIHGHPWVSRRHSQNVGNIRISVVTVAEVEMLLMQAMTPLSQTQAYFGLRQQITLLDVTDPIAHQAALMGSALRRQGQKTHLPNLLVAATAHVHNLTLITHHTGLFAGITGLSVADWSVP